MADLSVTAASVVKSSDTIFTAGVLGETVTAGQAVYKKSTDEKWYKAIATSTAEIAGSGGVGVALNGGAINQPVFVATGNDYTAGATVAVGERYYVSDDAAGGIMPSADLSSASRVTQLGIGKTTSLITLRPWATGVTKA